MFPFIAVKIKNYMELKRLLIKTHASALLAQEIGAEAFYILTDVPKVYLRFHKPDQKALDVITADEAQKYFDDGEFAAGSMGPKILAAIKFVKGGGKETVITESTMLGNPEGGTRIVGSR
ncbi:MAG: hypothetical protein MZV64_53940 [Ignavibacteriales bacterium]|nr:hypothetical protein [Ignavibacteriales bacterium]